MAGEPCGCASRKKYATMFGILSFTVLQLMRLVITAKTWAAPHLARMPAGRDAFTNWPEMTENPLRHQMWWDSDGITDAFTYIPVVGPEWNSRACAYDFASELRLESIISPSGADHIPPVPAMVASGIKSDTARMPITTAPA